MKYRKLGKYGVKVSEISIGTMFYGSMVTPDQANVCLAEALEQGINHIDCADIYGIIDEVDTKGRSKIQAEEIVGNFIKGYEREDLVLSSKVFARLSTSVNSGGLSRKHIREGIMNSLKNFQTDYLDIYYCHRPDPNTPLIETIHTMSNLIDRGMIHYWGTSNWPTNLLHETFRVAKENGYHPPHVEQPKYNYLDRQIEENLVPFAENQGMGIITYATLAGGIYSGKYQHSIPNESRMAKTPRYYPPERIKKYQKHLDKLLEIARDQDLTLPQLTFAWVLRLPQITSVLTSASKPDYIQKNADSSEIRLSRDIVQQIEEELQINLQTFSS